MVSDVLLLLNQVPFVPFLIRTSDGHEYTIPTGDHAWVVPERNRIYVATNDGSVTKIYPLHINGVVELRKDA